MIKWQIAGCCLKRERDVFMFFMDVTLPTSVRVFLVGIFQFELKVNHHKKTKINKQYSKDEEEGCKLPISVFPKNGKVPKQPIGHGFQN